MKSDKIIIFGNTNQANMANYYFERDTNYNVAAFCVDDEYYREEEFCNKPLIPYSRLCELYPNEKYRCFVAVGYTDFNKTRERIYKKIKEKGYQLVSYISPKALVDDNVQTGDNCFILEGCIVQPFVNVGSNVTLWSGSQLAHHVSIADHSFLSVNATVAGFTRIGKNVFIGANATVRDGIKIADYSVIGAGAWINKDTVEYGIYKNRATELYG